MYKPYTVIMPPMDITSGGIRVMWGLYGWLLSKGQIAFANMQITNNANIAIYPEVYHGNPAGGTTVVRYMLNKPGIMGLNGIAGPTSFDPTDRLYYFSRIFAPNNINKDQLMFLPIIDLHIFKNQKKLRNKTCYLVGKGQNTNQHPKDSILIDRRFASNQQALADLFNECHTFYSYDPITAMFEISRLCGCKVVRLNKSVDIEMYEPGLNGIDSRLDIDAFREHYIGMVKLFDRKIDKFIEDTQHD